MPEGQQIQKMFSKIARRYDFVNHALSLGMDFYWWRRMAQRSGAAPINSFSMSLQEPVIHLLLLLD